MSFTKHLILLMALAGAQPALAAMNHNGMIMDETGMIMNSNTDKLPRDCQKIAGDVNITVRAGHKYARKFNGIMYAFDQQQWEAPPCSRINVTFINEDKIRHQFMIHDLPGYIYPQGMFTMEIYGPGQKTASFIVPSQRKTYLVHCEVPQHMEKGMKAQLKVDGGDGDLPSIPGLSAAVIPDSYEVDWDKSAWGALLVSFFAGAAVLLLLNRIKR
ncbi:cupredoxin domain-containing protein [Methylobacter marinus]|uniref:cupredoxin domain-containing protein n=1 Tax=Methylobacter marinus TaxID=34058 RepID=UPI00037A8FA0|nr:cupredoxin domain-containing protein [Methylobacter marinus]